ncbi:small polypeptide DEVIL 11-like [Apium graveolens]|uniref:small polypeptide DEVIL 11-like n=1 Tax=Apium graveolens TaxID=4045 RepID=UPI003D7A8C39
MATASELFLDEKWKLSRKEVSRSVSSAALIRRINSSSKSKHQGNRRCGFTRKCASLVKEQRARFYIMRRCVTMLICWRDNFSDS